MYEKVRKFYVYLYSYDIGPMYLQLIGPQSLRMNKKGAISWGQKSKQSSLIIYEIGTTFKYLKVVLVYQATFLFAKNQNYLLFSDIGPIYH